MLYLVRRLRKWSDLSVPNTKPLDLLFLGPLLLFLTLICAAPIWAHPLLPLIVALSLAIIWRRRKGGWYLVSSLFALYLIASLIWGGGGREALIQELTFALGLLITYLSLEEISSRYDDQQREQTQSVSQLKISLHALTEKSATKARQFEKEKQKLSDELTDARKEIKSSSRLVLASQIEAKKSFDQNQILSAQSLELYRKTQVLKQRIEEQDKKLIAFREKNEEEKKANQERLSALNMHRVEMFQARVLIKSYLERLSLFRGLFLKKKKEALLLVKEETHKEESLLRGLEEKKQLAKKDYEKLRDEGKEIEETLKRLQRKLDRASQTEEIDVIEREKQQWENELSSRKSTLEKLKAHYVTIERELFLIRKEQQRQGTFVS